MENLNIKARRWELDITQKVLAERVGVTKQTISLYERGRYASPKTIREITRALATLMEEREKNGDSSEAPSLATPLGLRIREARRRAGMKQTELAERVGTSQQSISAYETDQLPRLDKAIRLCEVLEVSLDWLAWGDKKP